MNYKKITQQYLRQWMQENDLVGDYVIHHRDDSDEVRAYNKAHYKRWGCNGDGTFEYGKYVIFLTRSEHTKHHFTGKTFSEEHNQKVSAANKGKCLSEETLQKMSEAKTGEKNAFFGKHHSDATKEKISENNACYWKGKALSEEVRQKMSETHKVIGDLWKLYKQLHPESTTTYNEFRKSLKNNNAED